MTKEGEKKERRRSISTRIVRMSDPQREALPRMVAGFQLDDFLSNIIKRIFLKSAVHFRHFDKEDGVSMEYWSVLATLLTYGPQNITRLSERTGMEVSTASYVLKRMTAEGLVSRARCISDARITQIQLAAEGYEIVRDMLPLAVRYEEILCEGISERDIKVVKRTLRKVLENIERIQMHSAADELEDADEADSNVTQFDVDFALPRRRGSPA